MTSSAVSAASRRASLRLDPFVHRGRDGFYHPITDRALHVDDPLHDVLRDLHAGATTVAEVPAPLRDALVERGWLVPDDNRLYTRFRLKYVSVETHTVCNQACFFCPVSVDPRPEHQMPSEQFESIVAQLEPYRETLQGVFLNGYNEPTVDPRFIEQLATLRAARLPVAVLTNGTGLGRDRIEAIVKMGGIRYLCVNLSTMDRDRYREERGRDHLDQVLRNLELAGSAPVADDMEIVVLGVGNDAHHRDYRAIVERFRNSRFAVKSFEVNDRASYLPLGSASAGPKKTLRGCDQMGSRPLQHLHVTARADAVLCCQDYESSVVLGNLSETSVDDILSGPAMARARRWVYGEEEAPDDFICRHCEFALTE